MSNSHPFACALCASPVARFETPAQLAAHTMALHGGEQGEVALETSVILTLDMIDELSDEIVTHATPGQSRKILEALAKRVKVLADRLDARAIRSTRFAL